MRVYEKTQSWRERRKTEEYGLMKIADNCFLSCIIFETVGIILFPQIGALGAQMAIYLMTFLFALFLVQKNKDKFCVPVRKITVKKTITCVGIALSGIPIALMLNIFASMLSSSESDTAGEVNQYPVWLAVLVFAIVPAVVEEFVFRGVILSAYLKINTMAAVLISSLFFAMLHFVLGSVFYGFFYGCIFAFVRIATNNLLYSIVMHCVFNVVNVGLAYANIGAIQTWLVVLILVIGLIGFILLSIGFFSRNKVNMKSDKAYKPYQLLTKEGYVSVGICLTIIVMFLLQ